jgi:hypothetical protein
MAQQVRNVALGSAVKIVAADNIAAFLEQPLAEERAQETRPARNQDTFAKVHLDSFRGFVVRCRSLGCEWRQTFLSTLTRQPDATNDCSRVSAED